MGRRSATQGSQEQGFTRSSPRQWGGGTLHVSAGTGIGSNNKGELIALILALDLSSALLGLGVGQVAVFSDCLLGVSNLLYGWKIDELPLLASTMGRKFRCLKKTHPDLLGVFWVKGHSGIDGNDKADRLAKEGAKQHLRVTPSYAFRGVAQSLQPPLSDILDGFPLCGYRRAGSRPPPQDSVPPSAPGGSRQGDVHVCGDGGEATGHLCPAAPD